MARRAGPESATWSTSITAPPEPRRAPRELVSLAQAMAEVNSRVELEEVLALGVDRAASVLDAEVAVMTFRSGTGWIVASGFPGEPPHRESRPDDTPEAVLRGGVELLVTDLREDRWGEGTRAWAERHG